MNSTTRSVDELWLHALEQVARRAAHELKGALNGVAVNLEVVRSRSSRTDAPAAAVASFATVASSQLEAVMEMTDALLALTRPPREPVDVAAVVGHVTDLLRPAARTDGCALDVDMSSTGSVIAEVAGADEAPGEDAGSDGGPWIPGNTVRLAVASAMLAGMRSGGDVRCRLWQDGSVGGGGEGPVMTVEWLGAEPPPPVMDPEVLNAVSEAGVRVDVTAQGISLVFPR